jgi:hypothetical protein
MEWRRPPQTHFSDAQLARGLQAQMTVDDFAVAAGAFRDFEAKLPDAAAHAIHGRVVFARVARIENEFVNWPQLDALCRRVLLEVHGDFSWQHSDNRSIHVYFENSFPAFFCFNISTSLFKPGLLRVVRLRVSTKRVLTP